MKFLITFTILFWIVACQAHNFNFEQAEVKLWLWVDSSQIQIVDPETRTSVVLHTEYDKSKSKLLDIDLSAEGPFKDTFLNMETYRELADLLTTITKGKRLQVFFYGPREVDPLGPQPGESTPRFLIFGNKKEKARAVFPRISLRFTRAIINADVTQEEIDLELYKRMILKMLNRKTKAPVSLRKNGAYLCKSLFSL